MTVETVNLFGIALQLGTGKLVCLHRDFVLKLALGISNEEAANLAVWLLVMADVSRDDLEKLRSSVEGA